jgi:hypothetical protein
VTPTELTVTGRRCIRHPELAIPPGLAHDCGGHDLGILLCVRDSARWIHHRQDHLRVNTPHWHLWAYSTWVSRPPGTGRPRGSVLRGAATTLRSASGELRAHDSH